jgi:hypothetical protein
MILIRRCIVLYILCITASLASVIAVVYTISHIIIIHGSLIARPILRSIIFVLTIFLFFQVEGINVLRQLILDTISQLALVIISRVLLLFLSLIWVLNLH